MLLPGRLYETSDARFQRRLEPPRHLVIMQSTEATDQVTAEMTAEATLHLSPAMKRLISVLDEQMTRRQLQEALRLKHDEHFRRAYLLPAIDARLIELILPDTPRSQSQAYRLTALGIAEKARIDF